MDLSSEPWWPSCIAQVATTSVDRLAERYNIDADTLALALGAEGRSGPAHHAIWWPEAVREIEAGRSIRSVARRFGTEPRRIRRALARTGARASGVAFGSEGLDALAPFVDRLGQEPDQKIAKEAGVSHEAVQGERRRRGIAPFRQQRTRRPKLSEDDMMWIRGPKRNKREKFKPDAEVQVVRRPQRTDVAPPVMIRRPTVDPGHFEAQPRREDAPPRRDDAPPRREDARPAPRGFEPPRYEPRPYFRSEREQEIEALLNVERRPRDGRQRIVRTDAGRPEAPPEPERITRPTRRVANTPEWRSVDPVRAPEVHRSELPGVIRRAEVEARIDSPSVVRRVVEPAPMLRREEPKPMVVPERAAPATVIRRSAADAPVVRRPAVAVAAPTAEPVVAKPEPVVAKPEPVVAKPEPVVAKPEPVVAKPEPVVAKPEPVVAKPEPVVAPAVDAPVVAEPTRRVVRKAAAPAVAPAPVVEAPKAEPKRVVRRVAAEVVAEAPAAPAAKPVVAWYLEVPGWDEPLTYHATDIPHVLLQASEFLDHDLLAHALVWRVGAPRPSGL